MFRSYLGVRTYDLASGAQDAYDTQLDRAMNSKTRAEMDDKQAHQSLRTIKHVSAQGVLDPNYRRPPRTHRDAETLKDKVKTAYKVAYCTWDTSSGCGLDLVLEPESDGERQGKPEAPDQDS